jgi:hypothetical protein
MRLKAMKHWTITIVSVLLVVLQGCRKKTEDDTCPEIVSPLNHSTFRSGYTVSIIIYLPRAIQKESKWCFTQVYDNVNYSTGNATLDTMFYPVYSNNYVGTANIVLRGNMNTADTFDIETGIGNAGAGLFCTGVTVYVEP